MYKGDGTTPYNPKELMIRRPKRTCIQAPWPAIIALLQTYYRFKPLSPLSATDAEPSLGSTVVRRAVIGEKTATDVLDPNSAVRDPSDIEPGIREERKDQMRKREVTLHSR